MDIIDSKKIKEAANELCDYDSTYDSECRIDGFMKCAKWMQEEFLKDLWHPVSEKPNKARLFLYKTMFEGYGLNKIIDGNEWEYIIKYQKATQWLYIDDLFPKEGGNYD